MQTFVARVDDVEVALEPDKREIGTFLLSWRLMSLVTFINRHSLEGGIE
jgi:hypothetical protein